MDPRVRALYKKLLHLARDYPDGGIAAARPRLQAAFRRAHVLESGDLAPLLQRGEFVAAELEALVRLHKYRTMRRRYES